jgi:hypothetical protein
VTLLDHLSGLLTKGKPEIPPRGGPLLLSLGTVFGALPRWAPLTSYHVARAAYVLEYPAYRDFFAFRTRQGATVCLDPWPMPTWAETAAVDYLEQAVALVGATEVILPYVPRNDAHSRFLLECGEAARKRLNATLIVIPQGASADEWLGHYEHALGLAWSPDVLGIPEDIHLPWALERLDAEVPHHLHGLKNPAILVGLRWNAHVRSAHTNAPTRAGMAGMAYDAYSGGVLAADEWGFDPTGVDALDADSVHHGDWNHLCVLRWINGFDEGSL